MYLTASSTVFLLLSNKVEYLYNAFAWVVGGIGVVITIALALLGIGQLLYTRRLTLQEIVAFKNEIREEVLKLVDEQALNLKAVIDNDIDTLRRESEQQKIAIEADIARSYALKCQENGLNGAAFTWWLTAAQGYGEVAENNLFSISTKAAKESLDKIKEGDSSDIDHLWDKMTESSSKISKIKIKYPMEAKFLEELMNKKVTLSKIKKEKMIRTTSEVS